MASRPQMMKLPPRITFYPYGQYIHEGRGAVRGSVLLAGTAITLISASIISCSIYNYSREHSDPVPHTFSEEWKEAEEAKAKARRADPIHSHKIGEKV